jgi:biotin carboxyl carrier protein
MLGRIFKCSAGNVKKPIFQLRRLFQARRLYASYTIRTPPSGVESINKGEVTGTKDAAGTIHFAIKRLPNGEIVRTHQVGDIVKEDDVVAILDTAKVAIDIRSPIHGRVIQFHAEPGQEVDLPGAPIVTIRID